MTAKYKRVLIKLSGEAVYGDDIATYDENGKVKSVPIIDRAKLNAVCEQIKKANELGVQIGIVFGGGNIRRGNLGEGFVRTRADHMGMLATIINSIALSETLEGMGVPTVVMTAVEMPQFAETYVATKAVKYLEEGKVVIFGGGSGISHMTTDTTSVLRGVEIEADIVLLAKNVDAIYDRDPKKDKNAVKLPEADYKYILANNLKAIDPPATAFAMDNNMLLQVFELEGEGNIFSAICGSSTGSIVGNFNTDTSKGN